MISHYTYTETKEEEIVIRAKDVYKYVEVPQFFFDHCEFRLVYANENFVSSVSGKLDKVDSEYIPIQTFPKPRFVLSLEEDNTRESGEDVVYRYIGNKDTKKTILIEQVYSHRLYSKFIGNIPGSIIFIDSEDCLTYYKNMDVFRPAKLGENYLKERDGYTHSISIETCLEETKQPVIILKKISEEEFESVPPVNLLIIYPGL